MAPYTQGRRMCAYLFGFTLSLVSALGMAEGSRSLYPNNYNAAGARANLDLQASQRYLDRIVRRGFTYVYAEAGEYIVLGSSNRGVAQNSGDILVYNPQDFGIPGDETVPAVEDFSCANGTQEPGSHFFGGTLGHIGSRSEELAGPNSADNSVAVAGGFSPCAYQAPVSGIYGVIFQTTTGGSPNGNVASVNPSRNTVAAWDISVRKDSTSKVDINGRAFTYAFLGFTGANDRPIFSTLYYITADGYRYQQDLRGLDPNGYALFANTFGFLDNGEPLYKTLRGNSFSLSNLPAGVTTQTSEFPIFFSDVSPSGANADEINSVLSALGIPLIPPSPQISNVIFSGVLGGAITSTGVGGSFSFNTTDTVSYEIVISRNGIDFNGANPLNRMLSGIAFSGVHQVTWDGLDNNNQPFPASTTPYEFLAKGRNGEVHFPMIDVENNGNPNNANVPGGGPTITRLNGASPGDRSVFFDDRGYITRSGETVGNLNSTLCDNTTPAAAFPAVNLQGVDSSSGYRLWQYGRNRNQDCASSAGWGDAKAVNLWTYFLTPERKETLKIQEVPVDVATTVAVLVSALPGQSVQGTFSFVNNGNSDAAGVTYAMTLPPGLGSVTFSGLPGGHSAGYDNASGAVSFSGFPATLTAGQSIAGLLFSYTAPASGPIEVSTEILTTSTDSVPENNQAIAATGIGGVEIATYITGLPTTASSGTTVQGYIEFSNLGGNDAIGVTYSVQLTSSGTAPSGVALTGLPPGASFSYDSTTGLVTLNNMPETLVSGRVIALALSYDTPPLETLVVQLVSTITTSSADGIIGNNTDTANTDSGFIDVATTITGLPAIAIGGSSVQADITFSNLGSAEAPIASYLASFGTAGNAPDAVTISGLPGGASASYDPGSGTLTLSNMPTSLTPGASISMGFTFDAPLVDGLAIPVVSNILSSTVDSNPGNNESTVETVVTLPDNSPPEDAPPPPPDPPTPVPALPLPLLLLLIFSMGAVTRRRIVQGNKASSI